IENEGEFVGWHRRSVDDKLKVQVQCGCYLCQLLAEQRLEFLERLLAFRLEAQRQCRRGVRRSHQSPPAGEVDAQAVDACLATVAELAFANQALDQVELLLLRYGHDDFRRGRQIRKAFQDAVEILLAQAHDLEHPRGGIESVVKAVPALANE